MWSVMLREWNMIRLVMALYFLRRLTLSYCRLLSKAFYKRYRETPMIFEMLSEHGLIDLTHK